MKKLLAIVVGLMLSCACWAQVVTVKGVGTVTYSGFLGAADKEKAFQSAQVAAVERYFAENGEAEAENFEAIAPKIRDNLESFILSATILNEQDKSSLNKYSVSVRVELNVAKLRNTIRGSSATSKAAATEKSQLVYLFMGREASSVRSYDPRVVKRVEMERGETYNTSYSQTGSEGESIKGKQVSTNANKNTSQSATLKQSASIESGGSTTRKADDATYRLLPMANTKTSITSVFSQAGFLVADPEFVLEDKDMKAVNQDFSTGNDLAPSTIRAVVASLRKAQVPYLVLATLDLGAPIQDDASGMQRVAVSVTSRVLDLRSGLPREVASVPAVQYSGVGADNASAANKALKEASTAAAREIVSRLNAAQVR